MLLLEISVLGTLKNVIKLGKLLLFSVSVSTSYGQNLPEKTKVFDCSASSAYKYAGFRCSPLAHSRVQYGMVW